MFRLISRICIAALCCCIAPQAVAGIVAWGVSNLVDSMPSVPFARAVTGGGFFNLALDRSGKVVAWGDNFEGETDIPPGLPEVNVIAAGLAHSLALTDDGHVIAWGGNWAGQTDTPSGLSNVVAIAAGASHSLALKSDGTVWAWGDFGPGSPGPLKLPFTNAVAITAGYEGSFLLREDGVVFAWYLNQLYELNDLTNVIAIALGSGSLLALSRDGTLVRSELDIGGHPEIPVWLTNVVAIAPGQNHSLAQLADGRVAAWGGNAYGQTNVPVVLTNVIAIGAGSYMSFAIEGEASLPTLRLSNAQYTAGNFSVDVQTVRGKQYYLEFKDEWSSGKWTMLPPCPGNGLCKTLRHKAAEVGNRFYRVRAL